MVSRSESIGDGPINEKGAADNITRREVAPAPRVKAVHRIVPHDEEMIRLNVIHCRAIRKIRREGWHIRVIFLDNSSVHMTRKLTVTRGLVWVKGVDLFEVRGGGIEPSSVYD